MHPSKSRILAAIMLGASLLLLMGLAIQGFFSMIFLVGSAAIGCTAYLVITGVGDSVYEKEGRIQNGVAARKRLKMLTSSLFFLFSAFSLWVAVSQQYQKPVTYYALVAASGAALTVQIGLVDRRGEVMATLGQILFMAMNLFGSNLLIFPLGIGGADSAYHITLLVDPIIRIGHIPENIPFGLVYGSFPTHHILVATTSQVIMSDSASTYYAMGVLAMLLPVLVVFVVCRSLFNEKVGLLAALLLSGSSYYIFWASHAAALSFAIPLISTLVFVSLAMVDRPGFGFIVVAVILMGSLVFTHPYSSIIFASIILGLLVAQKTVAGIHRASSGGVRGIALIFIIVLSAHWIYYSSLLGGAVELAKVYYSILTSKLFLPPPTVYDSLPLSTIFVNTLGDSILISLAVIGSLAVISRGLSPRLMIVLGPAMVLISLSIVGVLTNLIYLLPNRIYVFLQFLGLVPLAAIGLIRLIRRYPAVRLDGWRDWSVLGVTAVLVGSFVFTSSTSTIAGFETSPFVGDEPYGKLYSTEYERQSVKWMCRFSIEPVSAGVSRSLAPIEGLKLEACFAEESSSINGLSITPDDSIDIQDLPSGSFVLFSHFDFYPGFLSGVAERGKYGQGVFKKLDDKESVRLSILDRLYDNGLLEVFITARR